VLARQVADDHVRVTVLEGAIDWLNCHPVGRRSARAAAKLTGSPAGSGVQRLPAALADGATNVLDGPTALGAGVPMTG